MTPENKALILSWVVGLLVIAGCLIVFPWIEPDAPEQLARAIVLKAGIGALCLLFLGTALRFLDAVSEGNWLREIGEEHYAGAAVVIGILFVMAYLLRLM